MAGELLRDAAVAVVSLAPKVIDCAYPSKTMMAMESGARLLVVVEASSELARMVADDGIGIVAEPGNAGDVERAILELAEQGSTAALSERSISSAKEHFDPEMIRDKWVALFDELTT
jgi:glycosyltransferase involved in cell wall biosynthesis